jgi:hypothetical protein
MKYALINAKEASLVIEDFKTITAAYRAIGLEPGKTDHGPIGREFGIVIYEFGLFEPPDKQFYFSIGTRLYGGNALVYKVDEGGETIDMTRPPWPIYYYRSGRDAIEQAIALGHIDRPEMSVNGEVFWQWPEPALKHWCSLYAQNRL